MKWNSGIKQLSVFPGFRSTCWGSWIFWTTRNTRMTALTRSLVIAWAVMGASYSFFEWRYGITYLWLCDGSSLLNCWFRIFCYALKFCFGIGWTRDSSLRNAVPHIATIIWPCRDIWWYWHLHWLTPDGRYDDCRFISEGELSPSQTPTRVKESADHEELTRWTMGLRKHKTTFRAFLSPVHRLEPLDL
jgi:hypothetical protein